MNLRCWVLFYLPQGGEGRAQQVEGRRGQLQKRDQEEEQIRENRQEREDPFGVVASVAREERTENQDGHCFSPVRFLLAYAAAPVLR